MIRWLDLPCRLMQLRWYLLMPFRWWHRKEHFEVESDGGARYSSDIYQGTSLGEDCMVIEFATFQRKRWGLMCDPMKPITVRWTSRDGRKHGFKYRPASNLVQGEET